MKVVYMLQHYYRDESHEDTKYIGLFSDKKKAKIVIERLKNKPGFNKFPNGFRITKMVMNDIAWDEGFYYPDLEDEV